MNINEKKFFHHDVKFKDGNILINNKNINISINKEKIKDISPLGKQYLISVIKQISAETLKNTNEILINQHDIVVIKNNLQEIKLDKISNINLIYENLIQKKQTNLFFSNDLWKKTNLERKEINKKIFAQLHNSHRLLNTDYEGNTSYNNIKEMELVLSTLSQDPLLSEKEKKIVNRTLNMMQERAQLAEKMKFNAISSESAYADILSKLKNNQSVYLPSGWAAKNGGHAVVVKFFREGDKLSYYIINKGAGVNRHPILKATGMGQTKRDIRSIKHQMSMKDFETSKGRALIDALYIMDQPQKREKNEFSYRDEDLYGICLYHATEIKHNPPQLSFASMSQLSGTCTQASLNASLLDQFLENGLSSNEIQRIFFLIKHKSLEMACQDWMKEIEKHPDRQLILRDAAHQHLMRIQRFIPHDQKDPFIKQGSLLAQAILQKLDSLKEKKEAFKLDSLNPIDISAQTKEDPFPSLSSEGVNIQTVYQQYQGLNPQIFKRPETQKEAIQLLKSSDLDSFRALIGGRDPIKILIDLTNTLRLLPLSHEKNKLNAPFWSGMPSDQAKKMLQILDVFTNSILTCKDKYFQLDSLQNEGDLEIDRMNEAMAIAYDIGMALAEQIDEIGVHLKKYPIAGPEKLLKKIGKGKAKQTLTQILLNFEERNKGKDLGKGKTGKGKTFSSFIEIDQATPHAHYELVSDLYGYNEMKELEEKSNSNKIECFKNAQFDLTRKNESYRYLLNLSRKAQGIKKSNPLDFDAYQFSISSRLFTLNKLNPIFKGEDYIFHPKRILKEEYTFFPKGYHIPELESFENTLFLKNPKVKSVENIDLPFLGELALMEIFSDTAPLQTFSWAKENLTLLAHPYVKQKIYKNLFSTSDLQNTLKDKVNQSVSMKLIHAFIKNALDFYKQSDSPKTYLWILEIAHSLTLLCQKEGIQCDFGNLFSEISEMLKSSQINPKGWNVDDKKNIAACYLAFSKQKPLEDPSSFAKAFFLYHHQDASSNVKRIYSKTIESILKHHKRLFEELGKMKEDQLRSLALDILVSRGIELKDQTLPCLYDPKKGIRYGDYLLTRDGQIEKKEKQMKSPPLHLKTSDLYREYFPQGECGPMMIDQGYYLHDSENLRLLPSNDYLSLTAIEQKISLKKGDDKWYRFIPQSKINEDLLSKHPSLPPAIFTKPNQVFLEVNTPSPRIVVLGPHQVKYVAEVKEGCSFVKVIHPNGEERKVADLNSLPDTSPWKTWLEQIEGPSHVLIEIEEKREEVTDIHFPRLGLHFKKKEKRFFCQEMPGFFLKENQSLPFDHYKGCLVLENEKKEVKTLIPFHSFKEEEGSKSCAMQLHVNVDLETIDEKLPYFTYKNQHDGSLRADSPQGALYLAVLYRTEKNYEKAIAQIKQSETYRGNIALDYTIAELLDAQPDRSPEGIAFDLQFYYRLKNHQRKFTTKDQTLRDLENKISEKTQVAVDRYKAMSSDKVETLYSIPVSLRLSKKQKKLLGMYEKEKSVLDKHQLWGFSYLTERCLWNQRNSFLLLEDLNQKLNIEQESERLIDQIKQAKNLEDLKIIKNTFTPEQKNKIKLALKNQKQLKQVVLDCIYEQKAREFLILKGELLASCEKAPEFNPNALRPTHLNPEKANQNNPIDVYLTQRVDDILEALSKPEQKDLVLRHLFFISRYPNLTAKPLLELLLAASHLKQEQLASILKEKRGIPRIVALIKMHENKKPTELNVSRFLLPREELNKTIKVEGTIKDREIKKRIKFKEEDFSKMAALSEYRSTDGVRDLVAPMQKFLEDHQFKVEEKVKNDYPALLFNQKAIEEAASPLAKKRMIQLNQALERLKQKKEPIYSSKSNVAAMKKEVEAKLKESELKAQQSRAYALEIANTMTDQKNLELRGGLQLKKLTLSDLKSAYLKQDGTKLILENPELNQKRIQEIFTLMMEADLAACQEKQCREMLPLFDSLLDKNSTQETIAHNMQSLGEIANRHFQLKDLAKYPQFSVFAAETGLWPRPDQIEVIDWFLEKLRKGEGITMSQILERSAGFGKSKVFLALVAQIAAQRGFFVSIYTTPNLIDFTQEDISSSSKEAFDQNFEAVNWKVGETEVTKENLQSLFEQMQEWKKAGHPVLKTPETWHLINIAHKKGKLLKDPELEEIANQILNFFDKGLSLIDEGHLNLNPLTEVNQVIGEKSLIPKNQFEELVANYDLLFQIKELGIKENTQSIATPEMIQNAQKALILNIIEREPYQNIIEREPYQTINKDKLKQWLQEPFGSKEPQWLEKILETNAPLFDLIEMQHRFVQSLFPHLMQQRGKLDYGENPETGKFYAAPRRDKVKTTSSYQDEYLTVSLTIQMIAQEGTSIESFRKTIHQCIEEHQKERKNQINRAQTSIEKILEKFLGNAFPLDHLTIDSEKQIQDLYLKLKNHSGFHQWYFQEIIYPQIEIYKEKISSTPAEFLSRQGFSLLMSATPGSKASYPLLIQKQESHQEDEEAIAHDLAQMIHHRNRQIIELEPFDHPKKFFDQIEEKMGNENMNEIQFIIDRGGLFRNVDNNLQVLEGLKENRKANKKGLIRPGIAVTAHPEMGRNAQLIRYGKDKMESVILPGSDLELAMKKAGQPTQELKDAIYFASIQETTGTDWKLPDKCKVIFTIGERLSLADADQGIKRDRKLSKKEHSFVWVVTKAVAKSIPHTKDLQPEDVINWFVANEAEQETKKIAMRFVQGVEQILIAHQPKKTGNPNAMLKSATNLSPSQTYQEKKELEKFQNRFIGQIVQNLKRIYPNDKRLNAKSIQTMDDLKKLALLEEREVEDLKKLIEYTKEALGSHPNMDFNQKNLFAEQVIEKGEVKEQQVEQTAMQEQVVQSSLDQKYDQAKKEIYNEKIHGLDAIQFAKWHRLNQICDWPKEVKGPPLYLSNEFLYLYKNFNKKDFVIRPISNLLVVITQDKKGNQHQEYVPLSQTGTHFYQEQLKNAEPVKGKKFALMSPSGDLLMMQTKNPLNGNEIQELEKSDSLKEALTLVALAKGKIKGEIATLKRVFGSCLQPQFEKLEKQIKKHLIGIGVGFEGNQYEKMKCLLLPKQETKTLLGFIQWLFSWIGSFFYFWRRKKLS